VLFMNKSPGPVIVPGGGKLLNSENVPVQMMRINNKGLSSINDWDLDLNLPGYSVTLITTIPVPK